MTRSSWDADTTGGFDPLKRIIVRLAALTRDKHPELDAALDALKADLADRPGAGELDRHADALQRAISVYDQDLIAAQARLQDRLTQGAAARGPWGPPLDALASLVESHPAPQPWHLEGWLAHLPQTEAAPEPPSKGRRGFLGIGRLRGSAPTDDPNPEPGFATISQAVGDVLAGLLQRLRLAPDASKQRQAIEARLQQPAHWYELVPWLEEVAALVGEAFEHSEHTIDTFVAELEPKLDALEHQLAALHAELQFDPEDIAADSVPAPTGVDVRLDNAAVHLEALRTKLHGLRDSGIRAVDTLRAGVRAMNMDRAAVVTTLESERRLGGTDGLTGVPNQRGLRAQLAADLADAGDMPLWLLLFEIEGWGALQQRCGALRGQRLVQALVGAMAAAAEAGESLARVGSGRFAVVAAHIDRAQAEARAAAFRRAAAGLRFRLDQQPLQVELAGVGVERNSAETGAALLHRSLVLLAAPRPEGAFFLHPNDGAPE